MDSGCSGRWAGAVMSALLIGSAAAQGLPPVANAIVMNGVQRPDLTLKTDDQGGWSFRYERDLRPDPAAWLAKDAPQTDMKWKGWEAEADAWRNGLYGGHLTYRLEFPYPVQSVTASAFVANYADTQVGRRAFLEYALDGTDWRPVAEAEYGVERKTFTGQAAIGRVVTYQLYVRLRQGARDENARSGGSVVFQEFSFSVQGPTAAATAADITLVVPDNPLSIPDTVAGNADGYGYRAGLTQVEAAKRLRMLIGRAVGVWPRIVPAAQTPKIGRRIYVGYGPHLKGVVEPPSRPEGLLILERDGDLYLLGEIAPDGLNNWPGARDRGVMYAVETFAEQVMGYRFLISTLDDAEMFELGTVIPKLDALTIAPGLRIDEAPVFPHRHFGRRQTDTYTGKGYSAFMGAREGSATAFYCNHSYNEKGWAQTYAKEHPEMFVPLVPDKVDADHAKAMGTQIQPDFLDYTEPLVLEKHLEHLDTFFKTGGNPGQVFYRSPTRTHIMEEPPDHIALSERYNERSRALWNPKPDDWGTFSNIWFDYLRRLSPEVKKRWPHLRISTLAYYRHYGVPTFEVPDNIDVMIAIMRSTMQCKEPYVFEKNLAHVKKWFDHLGKDRSRLYLWEYGCWPTEQGATGPLLCPFALQKWLQAVRPYVMGAAVEWYDPPEHFLMPRIWTRLLWNPDLDVAAEIADVCGRFHGPAGDTMTAFYRRLIERYEMRWENPGLLWDQTYADPGLYYGQSLPPAEVLRLAALLEKARVDVGLPAVIETQVQHGTAVYLFNAQAAEAPVRISLTALGHEVVDPAVGWDGSRMAWRGTLKPGERLDIAGAGQARVTAADGAVREADGDLEGAAPALAAGKAGVFHFWHAGADRGVRLKAELRYGPDGDALTKPAEPSIYARRLAWVRDPFLVFQPTGSRAQRGMLAEAHVVHQRLGQPPSCKAVAAPALPAGMDDPLWATVPAVELVRGREGGTASCDRIGLAADRRTRVRFVQSREGLAARIAAEGAPAEKEKLVLRLNDKALECAVAATPAAGAALRQIEIDKDGWRGLAVVGWGEIGLAGDALPAEISVQVVRESGPDGYIWSPAVGFPWPNGGAQGPGRLHLAED